MQKENVSVWVSLGREKSTVSLNTQLEKLTLELEKMLSYLEKEYSIRFRIPKIVILFIIKCLSLQKRTLNTTFIKCNVS
jgi:hypothetical protein